MEIKDMMIDDNISIREAMKRLDATAKQILLVVKDNILKGTVTDGDIRRWILKNGDLSVSVSEIVNYKPVYISEMEKPRAKEFMKRYTVNAIPVVNIRGEVESVIFKNDLELSQGEKENKNINIPVVIMAGGYGTRLYPYTKILPKPLIPIGDIPIVERIINRFEVFGCNEYYMAVNYKKNMIKAYFEDVEKEYTINYLEEDTPLGTAGALYFLKGKINESFFVSNCDILVDADYADIYRYHREKKNKVTMVCAVKNMTIPYGVVDIDSNGNIDNISEKPEYSFLTNTGIYLLEPDILELIDDNTFIHLTDIIQKCIEEGIKVGVYPITESAWMDMGQPGEMENMIKKLEEG